MLYAKPEMEIMNFKKCGVITTSIDTGVDGNKTPANGSWAYDEEGETGL